MTSNYTNKLELTILKKLIKKWDDFQDEKYRADSSTKGVLIKFAKAIS